MPVSLFPPSEQKLQANRSNSSHSTGPKSDEGKRVSSRNAVTHGLRSGNVVMYDEDPGEFRLFRDAMLRRLNPRDTLELGLVEQVIAIDWKMRRIRASEVHAYNLEILGNYEHRQEPIRRKIEALKERVQSAEQCLHRRRSPSEALTTDHRKAVRALEEAQQQLDEVEPSSSVEALAEMMYEGNPMLEGLQRYEQRLANMKHRCLRELRELRKESAAEPSALTAELLAERAPENEIDDAEVSFEGEASEARDSSDPESPAPAERARHEMRQTKPNSMEAPASPEVEISALHTETPRMPSAALPGASSRPDHAPPSEREAA